MNSLVLSDDELIENLENASPWFVGLYMETFLNNLSKLSSVKYIDEFTYDIRKYDPILSDENFFDIYDRVKSLLNIIHGNRVKDALNLLINYDTDNIYDIYARQEAIYLLYLISNNKLKLPN